MLKESTPPLLLKLTQIEAAAEKLSMTEQRELMLFLTEKLRYKKGELPEPRHFSPGQLSQWINEDEADMQHFSEKL